MSILWFPKENKYYEEVTVKIEALKATYGPLTVTQKNITRLVTWREYQLEIIRQIQANLKSERTRIISIKEWSNLARQRVTILEEVKHYKVELTKLAGALADMEKQISQLMQHRETLRTKVLKFENGKTQ